MRPVSLLASLIDTPSNGCGLAFPGAVRGAGVFYSVAETCRASAPQVQAASAGLAAAAGEVLGRVFDSSDVLLVHGSNCFRPQ